MSERTLIAIATDGKGKMWGGHFGMAPVFILYLLILPCKLM